MKVLHTFSLVILSVLVMRTGGLKAQNHNPDSLKVVTFNLYGKPQSEWDTRLGMILDELEAVRPDLIGLQEVVEPATGNTGYQLADSLSLRTGLPYRCIFVKTHFSWDTYDEGIAIITHHILLEQGVQNLYPGLFQRKVILAKVLTPIGIVNLFNTHLSFGNQQSVRDKQVADIKAYISKKNQQNPAPLNLLSGDFNSDPQATSIRMLTAPDSGDVYLDSWEQVNPGIAGYTVPSDAPDTRIDYIFLRDGDKGKIYTSRQILRTPNDDGLYPSDHVGVVSSFGSTQDYTPLTITSPQSGQAVSGLFTINWSVQNKTEFQKYSIYISNNGGQSWRLLAGDLQDVNSYDWQTTSYTDGTRYLLKIAAFGSHSFGLGQTNFFTVNNPGNAPPEIHLKAPLPGAVIQGAYPVLWQAADPEDDPLTITIKAGYTGAPWQTIAEGLPNSGSYLWQTVHAANSPNYRLIIQADDDSLIAADTSGVFSVQNERQAVSDSALRHLQGRGSGTVHIQIFDHDLLSGHTYRITFDDTLSQSTVYNVYDTDKDETVVRQAGNLDGVSEGPPFDGLRLLVYDYPQAQINQAGSGWTKGQSNLTADLSLARVIINGEKIHGFPYAADYRITVSGQVVDTSATFLGAAAVPMKFTVFNVTESRPVDIIFIDSDGDYAISKNDEIYILEKNDSGENMLTWYMYFNGYDPLLLPQAGDEFLLATLKPFSAADIFEFNLNWVGLPSPDESRRPRGFVLWQNFPNPFNPKTTISYRLPARSAGTMVRLEVYNILGQKVKTLVNKRQGLGTYTVQFDGRGLASGIYFYRLKSGRRLVTKKMLLMD